jgi:hypothetical protein
MASSGYFVYSGWLSHDLYVEFLVQAPLSADKDADDCVVECLTFRPVFPYLAALYRYTRSFDTRSFPLSSVSEVLLHWQSGWSQIP